MASSITVRGLGLNKYQTSKYMVTSLYLPFENGTAMLAPREIHIVNDLKANVLIGMNIMVPEKIDIIASQSKAMVGSCNLSVPFGCQNEYSVRGGPPTGITIKVTNDLIKAIKTISNDLKPIKAIKKTLVSRYQSRQLNYKLRYLQQKKTCQI